MPRYHFDLVDSKTIADQGGTELTDDSEATDAAEQLAQKLLLERPDLAGKHYTILVSNEDGKEIARVPLFVIH